MAGALAWAAPAAADFAAGVKAYDAGDYATAYKEWLPLAEGGDVAAQRNIGHLYRWGQGVTRDAAEAAHWYRRAAEQGFDRAQANLASLYLAGEGVEQDYVEAAKWFGAAAVQGHTVAQYNLALLFEHGLGVPKDEARALGLFNLAARAGHPQALDRLTRLVAKAPLRDIPKPPAAEVKTATAADAEPAKAEAPAQPPAEVPIAEKPEPKPERPGFFARLFGGAKEPEPATAPATTLEIEKAGASDPADKPEREPRVDTNVTVAALPDAPKTESPPAPDSDAARTPPPKAEEPPQPAQPEKPDETAVKPDEASAKPDEAAAKPDEPKPEPEPKSEAEPGGTAAAPGPKPDSPKSESGGGFLGVLRAVFPPEARRDERISGPIPPTPSESPKRPESDSKPELKPADDSAKAPQPPVESEPESKPAESTQVAAAPPPAAAEPAEPEPPPRPPFDVALAAYHQGDYQQALARWLPLARAGHARAQYYLGRMYRAGEGVPPDKVRAYLWWTLAARQGDDEAAKAAGVLAGEMTRGQVMDAEALAEGFRPAE